jgi:hypothetical protein
VGLAYQSPPPLYFITAMRNEPGGDTIDVVIKNNTEKKRNKRIFRMRLSYRFSVYAMAKPQIKP